MDQHLLKYRRIESKRKLPFHAEPNKDTSGEQMNRSTGRSLWETKLEKGKLGCSGLHVWEGYKVTTIRVKPPGALWSTLVNGDSENTLALGGDGVVWDR